MESFGIFSILPPIIAIVLAIKTRQVFISLISGIWIGQTIISGWNPINGFSSTLETFIQVFQSPGNTKVILFSALVGSLIALTQRSGGVKGFTKLLFKSDWIKQRKNAQFLAWIIGVVIFIESSIKILITGTICRPIFDKLKISREKLAYIADSTSASMCILIPMNAWGAFTIGLLSAQNVEEPTSALLHSIPLNFYAIVAAILPLIFVLTNFDFGPMKKAEERVANGQLLKEGASPMVDENIIEMEPIKGIRYSALDMIIPVAVLSIATPIGLIITGDGDITKGSGSTAVYWAVFLSIAVAAVMYRVRGIMKTKEITDITIKGAGGMISLALLMLLAFSLGETCKTLGTGGYIASVTSTFLIPALIPAFIFLISAFVAFSTGTSFGTFALMIPLAIPFVDSLGVSLPFVVSAVLGGGVFGDHCSPISDTTIVSSMASACDHIDHVNTQLPYALLSGGIALVFYVIFGFII